MKIKILLLALFVSVLTYAQKEVDAKVTLDSKILDVNLHQITGVSVVTTNGAVYGIDGEKGEKIWEFNESGFIKGLNLLGQDGGTSFREIANSPFGQFGQTIFDIRTGNKIIDAKDNTYNAIIDEELILNKKAILFFAATEEKNVAKLFLVNMNNDILWKSSVKSNKKISSLLGSADGVANFIQNDDRIAFTLGKSVFLINKNDGKTILAEKYDAGKLFFSEDEKLLIAVEAKGGSLVGSALKAGLTMGISLLGKKPIGKELIAFHTNSGEEAWKKPIKLNEGFVDYQFEDGKMFVVNKDGAMLYDYNEGKEFWKKEFKKNKVEKLEKTSEGYLVYFKNKKQLLDETGKKVWKKPQKVVDNVSFEADDDEDFVVYEYNKGSVFVTPYRIEYFAKGSDKRVYKIGLSEKNDKLAYDEKNKNLILLSGEKLYVINPDKGLGKEEVKKIDFKEADKVSNIEFRDNGYFINGNWEYAITDLQGNVVKKEYFSQPGEGLRHLKNFGAIVAGLGTAKITVKSNEKSLENSSSFVSQQTSSDESFYLSKHHDEFESLSNSLYTPQRYSAFKTTKNSAFFYTKKDGKKVLLQVNKDDGKIINTFEFGVNNPRYVIDELAQKIFFNKEKDLMIFSY